MFTKNILSKIPHILIFLSILTLTVSGCSLGQNTAQEDLWGRSNAKEIDINSKISGRVVKLLVKEGDTVKKGQIIAHIDDRELQTQASAAKANILALQANLSQIEAQKNMQSGTSSAGLEQSSANLSAAKTNLQLAEADFKRYEQLLEQGAVSRQTYDTSKAKYDTAVAACNQAAAGVAAAKANLKIDDVNTSAEAVYANKIQQAAASLAQIEVSVGETCIAAPFDGIITEKYVEEGSMISTGTPIYAIQAPEENWIDFKVPETMLSDFDVNQEITVEARDGKNRYTGVITDISQKAEFATQRATSERGDASDIITYNVKVETNTANIRPGMRFKIIGR